MFVFFKNNFLINEKKSSLKLLFLLILAAIFESLSLGSILSFFSIISDSQNSRYSNFLIGFDEKNIFLIGGIIILLIYIIKTFFLWYLIRYQSFFAYKLMSRISNDICLKYSKSLFIIDSERDNSIIFRNIIREPNLLIGGIILPVLIIATELSIIIGVSFFLLLYNPLVTISVGLFLFILGFSFLHISTEKLLFLGKSVQRVESLRIRQVSNLLCGSKDLFLFGMFDVFLNKFSLLTNDLSKKLSLQQVYKQSSKLFIELFAILTIFIVVFIIFSLGYSLVEIVSIVTLFLAAFIRILPSLNRVIVNLNTISFNKSSITTLSNELNNSDVLQQSYPIFDDFSDIIYWDKISINGLSFDYNENNNIILNLSFDFSKGDKLAIVGKSGSGKTTLVDIILGLKKNYSGNIKIFKHEKSFIIKYLPSKLVTYVPQNIFLFDGSIEENITLDHSYNDCIDYNLLNIIINKVGLVELINSLPYGLKSKVGEEGSALSGGQVQRIGLARALYRKSDILILDESTSALDETSEKFIIDSLLLDSEMTVLCITHNKKLASRFFRILDMPSNLP